MSEISDFQIVLREGIAGGFAGPTVKQVIQINGDHTGAIISHSTAKGTSKNDFNVQRASLSLAQVQPLVQSLKDALSQLPTENPPGSEDIYGLDTSIGFMSSDLHWQNGGGEGCAGPGMSSIQATPEQKQVFQSLVQSLLDTVQQFVTQAKD